MIIFLCIKKNFKKKRRRTIFYDSQFTHINIDIYIFNKYDIKYYNSTKKESAKAVLSLSYRIKDI
jgi:hypothetical protein